MGILAAAASAQGGFPHSTTLVDCIVAPPFEGEPSPVQRVSVLLLSARDGVTQGVRYRVRGAAGSGASSARIDHHWPRAFAIEEQVSLPGVHQGTIGRAFNSLHIERIDERQRRAELTLVEHAEYDVGRATHRAATGNCRLSSGPTAVRAFEEIAE